MAGYSKNAKITAAGTYIFALDWMTNPFNLSWQVLVPAGVTASYTVNYTNDPINPEPGVGYGVVVQPNPTWSPWVSGLGAASGNILPALSSWPATVSETGVMGGAPIRALQLVVSALSGGSLTVNILQPLSIN